MSDVTTESLAAELTEAIYKRWFESAEAGFVTDHAGLEALVALIDGLRSCATNPQTGAAVLRAAKRALLEMAPFAGQGDFAERLSQILERSGHRARRTSTPG